MKRTPMPRRTAPLLRSGGIARVSSRWQAGAVDRARVRQVVWERDNACLLLWHPDVPACHGHRTPHHLHKAGQGGPYVPSNLVWLCVGHNDWVEDNPTAAHSLGLVVRAGESVALAWQRMRAAQLTAVTTYG